MNIALSLSYVGTAYHGWQVQKNGASVQETVTHAINKLLKCDTYLSGVGRTDTGVHARRYLANFKADCSIPLERLPFALGAQLPEDIAVNGAVEVPDDFDARFQCTKKEYAYYVYPSKMRDPFLTDRAYRYSYPLDPERMQAGAQYFVGRHDFNAVRSVGTPVKSTVRTMQMDLSVSAYAVTDFYTIWYVSFLAHYSMLAAGNLRRKMLQRFCAPVIENRQGRRYPPAVCL